MKEIWDAMNWLESVSVRFRPKSVDTLEKVLEFTLLFERLSAPDKLTLSSAISDEMAKKLLSLSGFFAEQAMATGDAKWVRGALVLHLIEDFGRNYRENYRYLVLVSYAANYIKTNFSDVMKGVLGMASVRSHGYLVDFDGRASELNELSKFGVRISMVDNQPRFVPE